VIVIVMLGNKASKKQGWVFLSFFCMLLLLLL